MSHILIYSHDDVQALQARSSESGVCINIDTLESVRRADESYLLLRQLIPAGCWICPELELLSLVAGMTLELHRIKDQMSHQLLGQEPVAALQALLLVKTSAIALSALADDYKDALVQLGGSIDDDLITPRVRELGVLIKDYAGKVLKDHCNIGVVKERGPYLLELVDALLDTPVSFC